MSDISAYDPDTIDTVQLPVIDYAAVRTYLAQYNIEVDDEVSYGVLFYGAIADVDRAFGVQCAKFPTEPAPELVGRKSR